MSLHGAEFYTYEAGHVIEHHVDTDFGGYRESHYYVAVGHEGDDARVVIRNDGDSLENALIIARECAEDGGCAAYAPEPEEDE